MPRILIVSKTFPPAGSVGSSIRIVKFIKYTAPLGWQFVVLTQDVQGADYEGNRAATVLEQEIPSEVTIIRIATRNNKGRWRLLRNIVWGSKALWLGLLNVRKWKIDLVCAITPPFMNGLISYLLSRICARPFVIDLKDDWVGSSEFMKKALFRRMIETFLECLIVNASKAVVTVSRQSQSLYRLRYAKRGHSEKIKYIPNGCDIKEYDTLLTRERKVVSKKFTILCVAWGFRRDYRDISPFLTSLDLFLKQNPGARQKLEVILLGDALPLEYHDRLRQLDLRKLIVEREAVFRSDLINIMWKADLFLLVQPRKNTTSISGTLYEYWAVGKAPILLISETGASSSLVEENQLGKQFQFDQVRECAAYIESIYKAYWAGSPVWITRDGVERFDRRNQAMEMAQIWQEALNLN